MPSFPDKVQCVNCGCDLEASEGILHLAKGGKSGYYCQECDIIFLQQQPERLKAWDRKQRITQAIRGYFDWQEQIKEQQKEHQQGQLTLL
jgi:hypothetical protein